MHSRVISYILSSVGNHLRSICRQFYHTIAVIVDACVVIRDVGNICLKVKYHLCRFRLCTQIRSETQVYAHEFSA